MAVAILLGLSACQDLGIGCTHAKVQAEEALYDRAAQAVVFTARVTNRRGNPIANAPVAIIPLYGRENPGGLALAQPSTDADGIARGSVPMRRLQRRAAIGSPLTDEWLASFFPHEDIDDVFYCTASDHGALPPDVVHEANNAGTN